MIQYDVKTVFEFNKNELFDLSAFFENNFMVSNKKWMVSDITSTEIGS